MNNSLHTSHQKLCFYINECTSEFTDVKTWRSAAEIYGGVVFDNTMSRSAFNTCRAVWGLTPLGNIL